MNTMETLKDKKAFLFDLDGTLVDSMWMWKAIDIEYLGRFNIPCPDDLQKTVEGMSFTETAVYFKERFGLDRSVDAIKADWVDMSLEKYKKEVPLKEGARQFLDWARARGVRMGIATSNGRAMVDAVLDALSISSYFDQVTTACEVAAGMFVVAVDDPASAHMEEEKRRLADSHIHSFADLVRQEEEFERRGVCS